jgi:hypothetical protein
MTCPDCAAAPLGLCRAHLEADEDAALSAAAEADEADDDGDAT